MNRSPLYAFVICPNNSGSTLLVRLLATSRNVSVFNSMNHEGQWIVHQADPEAMPIPAGEELRNWTSNEAKFADPKRYRWDRIKELWHGAWDLSKSVLVEKSPPMVVAAPLLQEHFAPARFILSIRNPYAFCEGVRRKVGYPLATAAAHWVRAARLQHRNRSVLRDALFLRYEDLCEAPQQIASRLLHFIPELESLNPHQVFEIMGETSQIRDFNSAQIERLSAEELAEINSVLASQGELLASFGYELLQARP